MPGFLSCRGSAWALSMLPAALCLTTVCVEGNRLWLGCEECEGGRWCMLDMRDVAALVAPDTRREEGLEGEVEGVMDMLRL